MYWHTRGWIWASLAGAAALSVGAASVQAATWTETAVAGPVTATLTTTYSNSYDSVLDAEDMTLTITPVRWRSRGHIQRRVVRAVGTDR